jgi:hypothetical protein
MEKTKRRNEIIFDLYFVKQNPIYKSIIKKYLNYILIIFG